MVRVAAIAIEMAAHSVKTEEISATWKIPGSFGFVLAVLAGFMTSVVVALA